jgi:hypothetical protein
MKLKTGEQIKLTNGYAGARGTWPAGQVLTVGEPIPVKECQALVNGKYAVPVVEEVNKKDESTDATSEEKTENKTDDKQTGLIDKIKNVARGNN